MPSMGAQESYEAAHALAEPALAALIAPKRELEDRLPQPPTRAEPAEQVQNTDRQSEQLVGAPLDEVSPPQAVEPEQPHLDSPAPLDPLVSGEDDDSEPDRGRKERDEDYVGGEGEATGDDDWVDPQDEVDDEPSVRPKRRRDAGKATALWSDELDALLKEALHHIPAFPGTKCYSVGAFALSRRDMLAEYICRRSGQLFWRNQIYGKIRALQRNAGDDTALLLACAGKGVDGFELAERDWDSFLDRDLFPDTSLNAARVAFLKSKTLLSGAQTSTGGKRRSQAAAQDSHIDKKPRLASPASAQSTLRTLLTPTRHRGR
ncbi:hypothetical protein JCM10449v2_002153 [Rhodotorula kratochvilovae]